MINLETEELNQANIMALKEKYRNSLLSKHLQASLSNWSTQTEMMVSHLENGKTFSPMEIMVSTEICIY